MRQLHCSEKSATFSSEEEATSLINNVMDKNITCSRRNLCNLVCLLSFAHCLQELIVWLMNQNLTKTHSSWMENPLFYTQFSPLNTGNRFLGLCNFKIFWGSMPPNTPWKRGLLIQSVTLFKSIFYWNPCMYKVQ